MSRAVPPGVLVIGPDLFADGPLRAGATVSVVDWQPPSDPAVPAAVAALDADPRVDEANAVAVDRLLAVRPVLARVRRAVEVVPGLGPGERRLLHAGPPIPWSRMCGPMRGALIGAVLLEGWADDPDAAERLLGAGSVGLEPCHHHGMVGPMAGVVSPSMSVWCVDDAVTGRTVQVTLNEGLGRVLRFGAYGPEVLDRLRHMAGAVGPAIDAALVRLDGIELRPLMARALHMGDELHNRNAAASGELLKRLAPATAAADHPAASEALAFLAANDHTFLNLSMAACKLALDAAASVPRSTVVTAMARNGVEFGIRTSGTGDRWFTAPAPLVEGLFFPGFGAADAARDLGDSAITETAGLGGFAMAAAPAIVGFVGGSAASALATTRRMGEICVGSDPMFTVPALDFDPLPVGIDARAVADTGILPVINTGIAHREAGVGQIGAGITRAPAACFDAAVTALAAGA